MTREDRCESSATRPSIESLEELAISKQMLMRAATDALKLDPECTQEELQQALEGALKKVAKADTDLFNAKEEATVAITALEKKLAASQQDLAIAQNAAAEAKPRSKARFSRSPTSAMPPRRSCRRSRTA